MANSKKGPAPKPSKQNQSYVKLPHLLLDSGVVGAIGSLKFAVYLKIRRYEFSQKSKEHKKINELREEGWRVAFVNQTKTAASLGMHRTTMNRAIKALERLGWIESVPTRNNKRIYKIGQGEGYFAEEAILRVLDGLPHGASPQKKLKTLKKVLESLLKGEA